MSPEIFNEFAEALDEAILLLSSAGVILGISQRAVIAAGFEDRMKLLGQPLSNFVQASGESFQSFLVACRRSSAQTIGSLRFCNQDYAHRLYGRRISSEDDSVRLLLRLERQEVAIKQFLMLNEKIDQLNREVARRRTAETRLRIERDVAEFGRDIGVALVYPGHLANALARCTELMVQRLGAAFARIWLTDPSGEVLNLVASSGIYTHLDGSHGRIAMGEFKIGRIAKNQVPLVSNAVIGDAEIHDQDWATREGMVAFAGYPLVVDDLCVGVMAMFSHQLIADQVADAISSVANGIALRIRKQRIEDDLNQRTLALLDAGRRKDEFLAMLSHELRNPLAPVRSGLDLLVLENTEHHELIELMQHQVEHLVRLVDDLLDVSRIMRGKVELRKSAVELAGVVRNSVATLRESISNANQTLEVEMPGFPIWIHADAVRIKQILENLLKNACKYSDGEGKISLVTTLDNDSVTIQITDSGIGIDAELLPHVFDLFTQSGRTLDRSQGGLGIGLTLVKSLVEMHEGEVTAESEGRDLGSTFTIRLPACDAPSKQLTEVVVSGVPTVDRKSTPLRILAVDDNRGARMMLAKLFEKLGPYVVSTAADGPSALVELEKFSPDLVVLDIGLPGMSGYDVANAIRQNRAHDSVLLVALTGYGQIEDRRKSSAAGFDVHLVKPPGIDQLRELFHHPKLSRIS